MPSPWEDLPASQHFRQAPCNGSIKDVDLATATVAVGSNATSIIETTGKQVQKSDKKRFSMEIHFHAHLIDVIVKKITMKMQRVDTVDLICSLLLAVWLGTIAKIFQVCKVPQEFPQWPDATYWQTVLHQLLLRVINFVVLHKNKYFDCKYYNTLMKERTT